jgi:endonuclease G
MSRSFVSLCCFFLLATTASRAEAAATHCPAIFADEMPPALSNPKLEQNTVLLCNRAYAVLASGVTRGPVWSAEHLTAASLAEAAQTPRQGEFHPEVRLPEQARAELADYRHSGFDRGHMTPSGDMPDQATQQESFSLANVVPQTAELNRGIWERIERSVRGLAQRDGELYVVTGPAFHGEQLQSLKGRVLIPTSTWKAVYDPRANGTAAYVCKNLQQPSCVVLPISEIARVVGVDPFPSLPPSLKNEVMHVPLPEATHRRNLAPPPAPRGWLQQLLELLGVA